MRFLGHSLLLAAVAVVTAATKQGQHANKTFPRCDSPIYCEGPLLKTVQLAKLYPDSKTFVDKVCVKEREKSKKEYIVIKKNKQYADLLVISTLLPPLFSLIAYIKTS